MTVDIEIATNDERGLRQGREERRNETPERRKAGILVFLFLFINFSTINQIIPNSGARAINPLLSDIVINMSRVNDSSVIVVSE